MNIKNVYILDDRAILYLNGEDAKEFLQNLITNDIKKVSETIKSMEGENPWGLYYNEFIQGDLGRHVATVSFMKTWAEMDEDRNFRKAFEKLHGENSWDNFMDTMDDTFSNRWDEIWVYAPALTEMAEIGPTLLPGVLDAELSRGHPLLFHFLGGVFINLFGDELTTFRLYALLISGSTLCQTLKAVKA